MPDATTTLKPCPIMIAAPNMPSAMCIGADCAWWCGFANDCSVPLLAYMFADSEVCRNVFEEQEESVDISNWSPETKKLYEDVMKSLCVEDGDNDGRA